MVLLRRESVGKAPICPAGVLREGAPPVGGDGRGGRGGHEAYKLDVAAVAHEDERVFWGLGLARVER